MKPGENSQMFPLWMFVYMTIVGVIPIIIGMIPPSDADNASAIAKFAHWYANNKWLQLVWYALLTVIPLGITTLRNYRHPNIQAQTVINELSVHDSGFTWINSSSRNWITSRLTPARRSSGLMWEGYTVGISRESGKGSILAIRIYGSDQGVGHYIWWGRTTRLRREYGEGGHINMMSHLHDKDLKRLSREKIILENAAERASESISPFHRPAHISYNKETGEITNLYDDESGRSLHLNPDKSSSKDIFTFGPYPMAESPYIKQPGIQISEDSHSTPFQQLIFRAQDVYGKPLNHVEVLINSESGYRYVQTLPDDTSDTTITLPSELPHVQIEISRGGYHTLAANIDLNQNIQKVDAILEPKRKRLTHLQ